MNFAKELNKAQFEAVEHGDGPMLVLAGAGAGKTKTLTFRVLRLIQKGVEPDKILAVTFTNKAANEMRDRIFSLLPMIRFDCEPPFISTFHSLGVRILKENSKYAGLNNKRFKIYGRNDSLRAVREAMKASAYDPKQIEPSKILRAISRNKGQSISFKDFQEHRDTDYFSEVLSNVWEEYEDILRKDGALDFDDLLLRALMVLARKEILDNYQNRWRYIHIDEYQDTNRVQYLIAKKLVSRERNICVVGDMDQSIYHWRGADLRNILDFEKDYPRAKVVLLEENYRSTQNILSAANEVIQKNTLRKEKNLFSRKEEGEKIAVALCRDEKHEALFLAQSASGLIRRGVNPKEIAVLYRANFQSRAIEQAFLDGRVPYQVVGTKFFERKEIKDVISYISAAIDPSCISDLSRVINTPPRGIGKTTLLKVLSGKNDSLAPAMRERVDNFYAMLAQIKTHIENNKPSDTLKFVISASGLEKSLKDGTEEGAERLSNIRELVTLALRYDGLAPMDGMEKLLEDAALAADQDSLMEDRDAVKLMTVHASKGLEYDYVFIAGLEQGVFPIERSDEGGIEEREEERRLFYVALTRARKKIYLSFAMARTIFGSRRDAVPSEFITDIDVSLLEPIEPPIF